MTTTSNTARTWSPSDRDRMIYKWAKFDGHKQSWIADQLELNQATVSRIIQRYERWIAHGGPIQQGALNRDERLRAQLALTLERNEWIIASSMRMAGEMESFSDTSKSTTKHYCSEPSREIEVKTENSIRDRTDMAHRYLRLAWRVGMDQIKLIEEYDLPALEPFTLDEHEYAQTLEDAKPKYVEVPEFGAGHEFGAGLPTPPSDRPQVSSAADAAFNSPIPNPKSEIDSSTSPLSPSPPPELNEPMPATHNPASTASPLTPNTAITSIEIIPQKKPSVHAYALPLTPPEATEIADSIPNTALHQPSSPLAALPSLAAPSPS